MAYFIRKLKRKNDLYLQIYFSYFDKRLKQARNKHFETIGFVKELKKEGINDPINYAEKKKNKLNKIYRDEIAKNKIRKISDKSLNQNIGYFLIKSALDYLCIDDVIDILSQDKKFQFCSSKMLRALIYGQIFIPSSKLKMAREVWPAMYNINNYSENQIYDFLEYIGGDYKKYIEHFNNQIAMRVDRNFNTMYFDCTNYYFEIDLPYDDKQKGPSKENQKSPIIGQALLLDGNTVPLAMEMYPGNNSEQQYIRKLIKEISNRYKIKNKIIQVADKGLNSAQNIYTALKNKNGYIFSKKIKGKGLSEKERKWIFLESQYKNVYDNNGILQYKIKECVDVFQYKFIDENGVAHSFAVREKRVITFNPSLAKKQIAEIDKEVEKATRINTIKEANADDYGSSIKYVNFKSINDEKEKIKIEANINNDKICDDKKYAGYNLIITSEYNLDAEVIYKIYRHLSRIEECFRISKTILESRPVNVRKRETIYGHFLICFLALQILKFLEVHIFKNQINVYDIVNFIRHYNVTEIDDDCYINTMRSDYSFLKSIQKCLNYDLIENLKYTSTDLRKILNFKF